MRIKIIACIIAIIFIFSGTVYPSQNTLNTLRPNLMADTGEGSQRLKDGAAQTILDDTKHPDVGHVEPVADAYEAAKAERYDEAYGLLMGALLGEDFVANIETAIGILKALEVHYGEDTEKGKEISGMLEIVTNHRDATDQRDMKRQLTIVAMKNDPEAQLAQIRSFFDLFRDAIFEGDADTATAVFNSIAAALFYVATGKAGEDDGGPGDASYENMKSSIQHLIDYGSEVLYLTDGGYSRLVVTVSRERGEISISLTDNSTSYMKKAFSMLTKGQDRMFLSREDAVLTNLATLKITPVLFLDREVVEHPMGFKDALASLRVNEGNIPVVILTEETRESILSELDYIDLTGVRFSAKDELGLQALQWDEDERVSHIYGIDGLRCIPLTDALCETYRDLQKARDQV